MELYNEDCLEGMKRLGDGSIDAIICDPPYSITEFHWAVNTNRNFIGFELEKKYFDIARERIDKAVADKAQSLF